MEMGDTSRRRRADRAKAEASTHLVVNLDVQSRHFVERVKPEPFGFRHPLLVSGALRSWMGFALVCGRQPGAHRIYPCGGRADIRRGQGSSRSPAGENEGCACRRAFCDVVRRPWRRAGVTHHEAASRAGAQGDSRRCNACSRARLSRAIRRVESASVFSIGRVGALVDTRTMCGRAAWAATMNELRASP